MPMLDSCPLALDSWFVCQIGAREHYAIARALHARGTLAGLYTDFWLPPGDLLGMLPGARRLRDRFHPDLADARVHAPNARMLTFELKQRLTKHHGWPVIMGRNRLFQRMVIEELSVVRCLLSDELDVGASLSPSSSQMTGSQLENRASSAIHRQPTTDNSSSSSSSSHLAPLGTSGPRPGGHALPGRDRPPGGPTFTSSAGGYSSSSSSSSPSDNRQPTTDNSPLLSSPSHSAPLGISGTDRRAVPTVFSYSYAARDIFRFAKARGWRTVLGQIDPGPEEERIVAEEHLRYPQLASRWQPAPATYWENWREELKLADRIIVNSEWSRQCLLKEGVPEEKLEIVPLVYQNGRAGPPGPPTCRQRREEAAGSSAVRTFQILFLGQINLRKGIGRLLDAMRLLKDEPVELILAGPSEIDPATWADLPKVRWLGPVPRSEVDQVYQNADCFILPTLSDGYALTQLEALSHGLPVIASKHCGKAVTHGQNGWLLDDLEPETIAAAIRLAMSAQLSDIRPPEFSLDDLAAALLR